MPPALSPTPEEITPTLGSTALFPSKRQGELSAQPLNRLDPDFSTRCDLVSLEEISQHPWISHFYTSYFNSRGEPIGKPRVYSVERKLEQDVLDLVPYFKKSGEIYVGIYECNLPVLTLRDVFGPESNGSKEDGRAWNLPGKYVSLSEGEYSLEKTVEDLLAQKLGLTKVTWSQVLGGSYFPRAGTSPELCFLRAVEVHPPKDLEYVLPGERYARSRVVKFVKLQDIIDGYFAGTYKDTRMILAAFRLASFNEEKLKIPLTLPKQDMPDENGPKFPVIGRKELRSIMRSPEPPPTFPVRVQVEEVKQIEKPFLRSFRLHVANRNAYGDILEEYKPAAVMRSTLDSIDVGCYRWNGDKLCMAVTVRGRTSLANRNKYPHPIHTDTTGRSLEGVTTSLRDPKASKEEISKFVEEKVRQQLGLAPKGEPLAVGVDRPSPGYNPEQLYRFLVEVQEDQSLNGKIKDPEILDISWVDVDDVISLSSQGVIRDAGLTINAYMLKHIFSYTSPDAGLPAQFKGREERLAFEELMASGSRLQKWLSRNAPEIDLELSNFSEYRKLKITTENEGGVRLLRLKHPEEVGFFSALLDVYSLPSVQDPRQIVFMLDHDLWHNYIGDFIPYIRDETRKLKRNSDGSYVLCSREKYRRLFLSNECKAVLRSEVQLPRLWGVERFEKMTGEASMARLFSEAGLTEDEEKAAVESMILDAHIPDKILNFPRYEEFRPIIHKKLLGYHVRDTRNTTYVYDYWAENPHIAELLVQCCETVFTSEGTQSAYLRMRQDSGADEVEGVNPLKSALSRAAKTDTRLVLFKMATLAHLVEKNKFEGHQETIKQCNEHIQKLLQAYRELMDRHAAVKDTEPSPENIKAFRTYRNIKEQVLKSARSFADSLIRESGLLTPEQFQAIRGKRIFFYRPLDYEVPAELKLEVEKLERENFKRLLH